MQVLSPQRGSSRGEPQVSLWSLLTGTFHSLLKFKGQNRMCKMTPELLWKLSNSPPSHNYIFLILVGSVSPFQTGSPSTTTGAMRERKQRSQQSAPIALVLTVYDVLPFNGERSDTGKEAEPLSPLLVWGPETPHVPSPSRKGESPDPELRAHCDIINALSQADTSNSRWILSKNTLEGEKRI